MTLSSSASNNCDVFLSFRGEIRYSFISHLRDRLLGADVNTFIDKELERGEEISSALLEIIEGSSISIVVFSQDFASSTFCLDEVVKIQECKVSKRQVVFPVFYNVNPSDVQEQTGNYEEAFSNHSTNGLPSGQIQQWKSALTTVANLSGWHVENNTDEAKMIGDIVRVVLIRLSGGDCPLLTTKLVGEALQRNVKRTLEWLKNEKISRIGIYGMHGVGKTTLAIVIHNRLLEDCDTYGPVYWITVSHDFDIYNLQDHIAKTIRVDINDEKDLKKRAAKLVQALETKGRCILILDGIWNHFPKAEVGIPEKGNGSKLIVTTQSLKVCENFYCDKKVKVDTLVSEEAWNLFMAELENPRPLSPEINEIAKSMVRECDGLSLGIIKMAERMRGVDDVGEWRNMLKELKNSHIRDTHAVDDVLKVLKSSYNDLSDRELQQCIQCILYCALFPENFQVRREKLIEYLIVEGIIERMNTRQEEYDRGITVLNKLESVCLLEGVKDDGVKRLKLHKLVRHMAIQLIRSGPNAAMVESGKQLSEIPKSWKEDLVRVSLINNEINKISPTYSPKCPKLLTLLLQTNNILKEIPDSFFHHMQNLRVLDLSHTGIIKLPASVCSLENLIALLLNGCKCLTDMPSLAKLGMLEKLDLSFTKLKEVPPGMKNLTHLRYLNIFSYTLKKLPRRVLPKFLQLQYLRLYCNSPTPKEIMEEVACLPSLETLVCWFQDIEDYMFYVQLLLSPKFTRKIHQPVNYSLRVGKYIDTICSSESLNFANTGCREVCLEDIDCNGIHVPAGTQKLELWRVEAGRCLRLTNASKLKSLSINFCETIESLTDSSETYSFESFEKLTLTELKGLHILFKGGKSFSPQTAFCNLKKFGIFRCNRMKRLFYPALLKNLQNLQVLHVCDCGEMEEIIVSSDDKGREFSLPELHDLRLVKLPKLKSICSEKIICRSLRQVEVIRCENLKYIPISLPSESLQKLQVFPEEWWESVEWGDSTDYKMQYKPSVYLPKIEGGCWKWEASQSSPS